jgi:hypothetical protein
MLLGETMPEDGTLQAIFKEARGKRAQKVTKSGKNRHKAAKRLRMAQKPAKCLRTA